MLKITGLNKNFGQRTILSRIDLEVARGECVALFGPSGSGKTTLLRIIAGLDQQDSGRVEIAGQVVADETCFLPVHLRQTSLVFQNLALWPHLTALENVEFMLPDTCQGRPTRRDQARSLLAELHLDGKERCYPSQLSRGEQQRTALARALASAPQLLLLDEPLSSLDWFLKHELLEWIHALHQKHSLTILYVSHSPEEVAALARRVAVLEEQTLTMVPSIDDFLRELHRKGQAAGRPMPLSVRKPS